MPPAESIRGKLKRSDLKNPYTKTEAIPWWNAKTCLSAMRYAAHKDLKYPALSREIDAALEEDTHHAAYSSDADACLAAAMRLKNDDELLFVLEFGYDKKTISYVISAIKDKGKILDCYAEGRLDPITYHEVFRQCDDADSLLDAMIRCRENKGANEGLDVEALEMVKKPLFYKLIRNNQIATQFEGGTFVSNQIRERLDSQSDLELLCYIAKSPVYQYLARAAAVEEIGDQQALFNIALLREKGCSETYRYCLKPPRFTGAAISKLTDEDLLLALMEHLPEYDEAFRPAGVPFPGELSERFHVNCATRYIELVIDQINKVPKMPKTEIALRMSIKNQIAWLDAMKEIPHLDKIFLDESIPLALRKEVLYLLLTKHRVRTSIRNVVVMADIRFTMVAYYAKTKAQKVLPAVNIFRFIDAHPGIAKTMVHALCEEAFENKVHWAGDILCEMLYDGKYLDILTPHIGRKYFDAGIGEVYRVEKIFYESSDDWMYIKHMVELELPDAFLEPKSEEELYGRR